MDVCCSSNIPRTMCLALGTHTQHTDTHTQCLPGLPKMPRTRNENARIPPWTQNNSIITNSPVVHSRQNLTTIASTIRLTNSIVANPFRTKFRLPGILGSVSFFLGTDSWLIMFQTPYNPPHVSCHEYPWAFLTSMCTNYFPQRLGSRHFCLKSCSRRYV